MDYKPSKKIILVSRCAWTLFNFRSGLIQTLIKLGYRVTGAGAGGDGFEPKIQAMGVPFVSLPVDKKGINPLADIKLFWAFFLFYKREKPEIVHHFTIKPVIYGSIAARLARVPLIINTIPGLGYVFSQDAPIWLKVMVKRAYQIALARAHYTFFQNRDDLNLFLESRLVTPKNTAVLPGSGVDLIHFSPLPVLAEKNRDNSITFLLVSRLLREKGIYEFVSAAREIRKEYPLIKFHLLGKRDERNPSVIPEKDLDRWEAEGIVHWLGEANDVRPIMAEADVVVLPSYYREGIPRSLLEAAAMEKPIITTRAIGCREAVDDRITGLLISGKNVQALIEAMVYLIHNPGERRKMGKAGREKMIREFDEKNVIQKTVEVYDQLFIGRKKPFDH